MIITMNIRALVVSVDVETACDEPIWVLHGCFAFLMHIIYPD